MIDNPTNNAHNFGKLRDDSLSSPTDKVEDFLRNFLNEAKSKAEAGGSAHKNKVVPMAGKVRLSSKSWDAFVQYKEEVVAYLKGLGFECEVRITLPYLDIRITW